MTYLEHLLCLNTRLSILNMSYIIERMKPFIIHNNKYRNSSLITCSIPTIAPLFRLLKITFFITNIVLRYLNNLANIPFALPSDKLLLE